MTNTSFRVSYDGFALQSHEMNVKDLAPALLAIGELLEETNHVINGDRTKVAVNIKGSPTSGSVNIDFSVVQQLTDQAVSLFSGDRATAAANLIQILGIGGLTSGFGLIAFIKWLKNRPIKNITKLELGGFKITLEDDDTVEEQKEVIEVFQNLKIRRSLEAIIHKPLQEKGIESVAFSYKETKELVKKEESSFFTSPETEQEIINESASETSLQIVSISFQKDNKWRFSDGNAVFFADIQDQEFIKKVEKNEESFSKDDILKVTLKRKQYLTPIGMRSDYSVIKVLDHRSAAIQIKLPFSETPEN